MAQVASVRAHRGIVEPGHSDSGPLMLGPRVAAERDGSGIWHLREPCSAFEFRCFRALFLSKVRDPSLDSR